MLSWLKGRLEAGRIATWNTQLASELDGLTPSEVAAVLIKGMDFALSFRQHNDGFMVSKSIEEPSKHLAPDGARELYGRLENILLEAQAQAGPLLQRARESLAEPQHALFSRSVALSHVSLRLLMFRIAGVFGAADAATIKHTSASIRAALPRIDEAANAFEKEQRATRAAKDSSHYRFLRDMAYNYATMYPL